MISALIAAALSLAWLIAVGALLINGTLIGIVLVALVADGGRGCGRKAAGHAPD